MVRVDREASKVFCVWDKKVSEVAYDASIQGWLRRSMLDGISLILPAQLTLTTLLFTKYTEPLLVQCDRV
ncbi:hypothetical protein TNCV_3005421 [Trichonephila clavipes]|nr:hypothetical protein TNCV_3005421 [Trichonephila clavipes]